MRTGPGQMPVFGEDTFTDQQATDIAAYVTGDLQHPDNRGGFPLGSTGPVPEGFVAWTVGIVIVGAALRWIVRGLPESPCLSTTSRTAGPAGPGADHPGAGDRLHREHRGRARAGRRLLGRRSTAVGGGAAVPVARRDRRRRHLVGHRFLPEGPDEEEREPTASSDEQLRPSTRSWWPARRRSAGASSSSACWPGRPAPWGSRRCSRSARSVRSRGPGLKASPFTAGDHLLTSQGERVRPADVEVDGFITVFPSSDPHNANGPTLLIHMRPGQNQPRPGRDDWTVDDLIAYSKICTHAGCPVGLYQAQSGLLLCPCHQSTFEVADGAQPIFGPATRSLPLLTPMSEVAGRMSIQVGAHYLEKTYGGRGQLLGGVPGVRPSNVVIIGGGVVGTNAAQMALGAGAAVTILEKSADRMRYPGRGAARQPGHGDVEPPECGRRRREPTC